MCENCIDHEDCRCFSCQVGVPQCQVCGHQKYTERCDVCGFRCQTISEAGHHAYEKHRDRFNQAQLSILALGETKVGQALVNALSPSIEKAQNKKKKKVLETSEYEVQQ